MIAEKLLTMLTSGDLELCTLAAQTIFAGKDKWQSKTIIEANATQSFLGRSKHMISDKIIETGSSHRFQYNVLKFSDYMIFVGWAIAIIDNEMDIKNVSKIINMM